MNFVTINWNTNDGKVASTQVEEAKADVILQTLNKSTKAWISEV